LERGDSSAVGRDRAGYNRPSAVGPGLAGYNRPDQDQQHCYHHAPTVKQEAATAVVVTPDDGREDARNMLSCS